MKTKSIKKNYIYNLLLTVTNMIFPLITAPYISYVLGAENIGKVNYSTSIITWFMLFASFGIPRYGIREIARNRDDRKKLSNSFWNLILIQGILSIICLVVYLFMIFNIDKFNQDMGLYLLMIVMLVLNVFSIDWFYQGIEEFGYIAIRNIIVKIISIVLIFTMIKERNQYLIYALINILGLSFNNILNYVSIKRYIDKKIEKINLWFYMKELKIYFFTTLIVAFYNQLDQLFVGSISEKDLAYYLRSKTLLGVGFSVVNSITTIFIPRTAYLAKNNYAEYKKVIMKSLNYIYLLAFPCAMGLFILAEEVMRLFGGNEFVEAKASLQIISILIIVISVGGWQINQILLANKMEKLAFYLQTTAAVVSVILNLILIPKYSYIGASIAWVLTETVLLLIEVIMIRKKITEFKIKYFNKSAIKYFCAVIIMGLTVFMIKNLIANYIVVIIVSLITAPVIYFGVIVILKDEIILESIKTTKKTLENNFKGNKFEK